MGFAWFAGNTVAQKAVNLAGQIVLAWLLLRKDYDLIGLAYTVTMFAGLIRRAGLQEVLIQRHGKLHVWAGPAFWMSACLGMLAAIIACSAIPFAVWFYRRPELAPLMLVIACAMPIDAMATVANTKLYCEMRYRAVAILSTISTVVTMGATVLLASLGYGAMSFAIAAPTAAVVRLILFWLVARPPFTWNPHLRRWRFLLPKSGMVVTSQFALTAVNQADYIALGRYHTQGIVGAYYFAFNLSIQTVFFLETTIGGVLLPSFSTIRDDRKRLVDAYLRATRMLAAVGVPVCILQAMLTDPVFHMVFPERWYVAIPLMQVLSLGMIGRLVSVPARSLMLSDGRFRTDMIFMVAYACIFGVCAFVAAAVASPIAVATTVALCTTIFGPTRMRLALQPDGGTWADIGRTFLAPISASAVAVGAAAAIAHLTGWQGWAEIAMTVAVTGAVYIPLMKAWAPKTMDELWSRAKGLRAKQSGGQTSDDTCGRC